ncbi:hypothetical protein GF362_07685 [Candidatus Dojkabacteria bacterium]|nr:hypothetical protein [Candidatus Dojkabacteria bacterium]
MKNKFHLALILFSTFFLITSFYNTARAYLKFENLGINSTESEPTSIGEYSKPYDGSFTKLAIEVPEVVNPGQDFTLKYIFSSRYLDMDVHQCSIYPVIINKNQETNLIGTMTNQIFTYQYLPGMELDETSKNWESVTVQAGDTYTGFDFDEHFYFEGYDQGSTWGPLQQVVEQDIKFNDTLDIGDKIRLDVYCFSHLDNLFIHGYTTTWIGDAPEKLFVDVTDKNYQYYDAIQYAKENYIVHGFSDNTFRPDNYITRGEFTKVIIRSQFSQSEIDDCKTLAFPDITSSNVFKNYICVASKHNIVNGFTDGTYKTNNNITLAEATKIISHSFGFTENVEEVESINPVHQFKPYIIALEERNAFPSTDTTMLRDLTRGEMVEMIYRILENITDKPSAQIYL